MHLSTVLLATSIMPRPKAGSKWFNRPSNVCRICGQAAGTTVDEVEDPLAACLGSGKTELQLFSVEDRRQVFRLVFAAKPTATFDDLDAQLRLIWMECCGHLSEFTVLKEPQPTIIPLAPMRGIILEETPAIFTISTCFAGTQECFDDWRDSTRERLSQHLGQKRLIASYAYDFGSTTAVYVIAGPKVSVPPGVAGRLFAGGSRLALVARNERPQVPCCRCGKPALYILNSGDNFEEKESGDFWCSRACARRSPHDAYLISRFWNSPRSGVCGYDGPQEPEPGEDLWEHDSSRVSVELEELLEEQQLQRKKRRAQQPRRAAAAGGPAQPAAATKRSASRKAAAASHKAAGKATKQARPASRGKAAAASSKGKAAAGSKAASQEAADGHQGQGVSRHEAASGSSSSTRTPQACQIIWLPTCSHEWALFLH